jgi:hypothetical protein
MKATGMWEDPTFLRHVIPPEEDQHRIYPSTGKIEPRWFRSQNVYPIERHPELSTRLGHTTNQKWPVNALVEFQP